MIKFISYLLFFCSCSSSSVGVLVVDVLFVTPIGINMFLLGKDLPILNSCSNPIDLNTTIIYTGFRIDIRIRHRSGFHLGPERLLPLVPRSNPGLIP